MKNVYTPKQTCTYEKAMGMTILQKDKENLDKDTTSIAKCKRNLSPVLGMRKVWRTVRLCRAGN